MKEWSGSCGQCGAFSAGFSWLRAPQLGNQKPWEWVACLFTAALEGTVFSKQLLKSSGSPQGSTQVEGGSPLQGWPYVLELSEDSMQGYHGTPGSGSRVLLKAMCFAEYFCSKELIFFWWKQVSLENTHAPSTENTDKSSHNNA